MTAEAHQSGGAEVSTRSVAPIQHPSWTPSEGEHSFSPEAFGREQTRSLDAPEDDFAPTINETPHVLQLPSPSQQSVDSSISSPSQSRLESPLYVEPAPNLITPRYAKLLHHFKTAVGWPWVSLIPLGLLSWLRFNPIDSSIRPTRTSLERLCSWRFLVHCFFLQCSPLQQLTRVSQSEMQ